MKEVEISQIETQYENKRIKDKSRERSILSSILEGGIREPLKCVIKPDGRLTLLDGFKRLRCSIKLGMKTVPVESLGSDESMAILKLLRLSNSKMLSILEQAALVDELNKRHKMSVTEISRHLERSVAWVSVLLTRDTKDILLSLENSSINYSNLNQTILNTRFLNTCWLMKSC